MYKVKIYKDSRHEWRWRLLYNKNVLAVGTNGYASAYNAKRAIIKIIANLQASIFHFKDHEFEIRKVSYGIKD